MVATPRLTINSDIQRDAVLFATKSGTTLLVFVATPTSMNALQRPVMFVKTSTAPLVEAVTLQANVPVKDPADK
ncbi:MAG: hypothetical protein A2493_03245 [Candidatus Magasanikbacteria bacterium RIFOXYC12_FULL_33_11]|uniref:Uncharacterized protein n=1 Tax=Candidatus Magasanikbacteria bacterium RIFOXYC12_FULL_33_11 TaxID=1798701 RepID=A0A1F6NPW9_9BACT|nr:MAG: hypothetical protein A2493_03245 [Candidatus Magasanikbacteria bacterium RIFOXYC12_FULL_33_11]